MDAISNKTPISEKRRNILTQQKDQSVWLSSSEKTLLNSTHRNNSSNSTSASKGNKLHIETLSSNTKDNVVQERMSSNECPGMDHKSSKQPVVKDKHKPFHAILERDLKLPSKNNDAQRENEANARINKEELSVVKVSKSTSKGTTNSMILNEIKDDLFTGRPENKKAKRNEQLLQIKKSTSGTESCTSIISSNQKTKQSSHGNESTPAKQEDKSKDKIFKKSSRKKRKLRDEDRAIVPNQILSNQILSSNIITRPQGSKSGKPPKKLINQQDKSSVSEYCYFLLHQVMPCFTVEDHGDQNVINVGIECQYCSSSEHPFRLFPTSPRRLRTGCIQVMHEHLTTKCKHVPSDICPKLVELKNEEMRDYAKIKPSKLNSFFDRVWNRLHKMKNSSTFDKINILSDERSVTEESLLSGDDSISTRSLKSTEDSSKIDTDFESKRIVQKGDQKDISEYQYFLLQQVHTCISGKREMINGIDSPPSIGIECIPCSLADSDRNGSEKFQLYPTSARRLRTSLSFVYDHLLNCRHVTDQVKKTLVYLRGEETRNYTKIKPSQLDNFFETLWKRLSFYHHLNDARTTASAETTQNTLPSNVASLKGSIFTPQRDVEI